MTQKTAETATSQALPRIPRILNGGTTRINCELQGLLELQRQNLRATDREVTGLFTR